jgi:hypothetical protein
MGRIEAATANGSPLLLLSILQRDGCWAGVRAHLGAHAGDSPRELHLQRRAVPHLR